MSPPEFGTAGAEFGGEFGRIRGILRPRGPESPNFLNFLFENSGNNSGQEFGAIGNSGGNSGEFGEIRRLGTSP